METIWEYYEKAQEIITKLCAKKCSGRELRCEDYIIKRLAKNNFQALKNYDKDREGKESKKASITTYLHMLINSRLIDFVNSAPEKREMLTDSRIIDVTHTTEPDISESIETQILDDAIETLSDKDKLYLKLKYQDELSNREIANIVGDTSKNVSNHIGRVHAKLKQVLEKQNYKLEDLL